MASSPFIVPFTPDWQAFIHCLKREGTPRRVHNIELLMDWEVQEEICQRYGLIDNLDVHDPYFYHRRIIAMQRFLGYDYVVVPSYVGGNIDEKMYHNTLVTEDTASLKRPNGRGFVDEHKGVITTWEEFENYPWPDPDEYTIPNLVWFEKNLPDDMCVIGGLVGSIYENLSFLMGYENLCYALYEQRDLVEALSQKIIHMYTVATQKILQYERVKVIWGSDDLGFRSGTLISPRDLRSLVLPGHRQLAKLAHDAGRLYIMHCCGNLDAIMPDLLDVVKIDGRHSFEDTILDVRDAKQSYGDRIAMLGGIDMDFLCRANKADVRQRVRETLTVCQPGGGYCLGTGNTVANYIPIENYLAMLDEGRKF
jgi:uroporphyrinogen decarboxylase